MQNPIRILVGTRRWASILLSAFALALSAVPPISAAQNASTYSQDELDQLLAPIALYPDQLLTQILIASTYPLEVVEAARFIQQNSDLKGQSLDDAVAQKNWDASVHSLTAFPQVLAMMDDKIEWMQRLGDAFLARCSAFVAKSDYDDFTMRSDPSARVDASQGRVGSPGAKSDG